MKDKLYKTHRKVNYYRVRKAVLSMFFLTLAGATLVLPYRFVNQTINEFKAQTASEETPSIIDEEELLVPDFE